MLLTPEQRSLRARAAAHAQWAAEPDRAARTQRARDGFLRRFEAEVDPLGQLDPQERLRRAEHARKAWMLKLALRSSRARAARKVAADAAG